MQQNNIENQKIMIMAGGTGGHIFCALAVANALEDEGAILCWLGTKYGLETKLIGQKYPLFYLPVRGVRKKGLIKNMTLPFKLVYAIYKAIRIIKEQKIKVVVGFGGYPAISGGLAACLIRVPLIIHEQNARPGITNRILAKFTRKVLCAFPTSMFKNKTKIKIVGNPIRNEIKTLYKEKHDFYKHGLNLLVLGGSQGAKILNELIPQFIMDLPKENCVNLWHQTGEQAYQKTQKAYHLISTNYSCNLRINSFISDIEEAYRWADVIICRSGALTVSELACAGLPALFIPFAKAVDNHQYYNAQFLVQVEAAMCMSEQSVSVQKLIAFVRMMDMNRNQLKKMSNNGKGVAKLDAVEKIVAEIKKYIST